MKKSLTFILTFASVSAGLALVACGGGDSGGSTAINVPQNAVNYTLNLVSPQLQNSSAFLDVFSANFLDDGYTKANLVSNVQADSAAIANGTVASDSVFPEISASILSISDCNAATNICILNTTYTTSGPDATTVTSKVPVLQVNGNFTIVGNGSSVQPS